MFQEMVTELQKGKLPDLKLLRKRFEAALVKKMGVIRTPYSFWPGDTKINPPAKHLLWAATLLDDKENFNVVAAIIATELEEKKRAKGHASSQQELGNELQGLLDEYLRELLELAPDETFRQVLRSGAGEILPAV